MSKVNAVVAGAFAGAVLIAAAPALAAQCNHKCGFKSFIADFKKEAASKGISSKGLAALDGSPSTTRCAPPTSGQACSSRASKSSPAE